MSRSRTRLHDGWLFHAGELSSGRPGRGSAKAGDCGGASDLVESEIPPERREVRDDVLESMIPGFAESRNQLPATLGEGWRPVRLPHDWRIEQTPRSDGPIWQAFLPGGVAYYRLVFSQPAYDPGRRTVVEFEGVMRDATVWCNGFLVGDHPSGYTGFTYDLTELLRYDDEGENVLLVRCDTTTAEGWWYEGGGIYRNVWLHSLPSVHVELDGVWVTTPSVSREHATVRAEVRLRNSGDEVLVRSLLVDPSGVAVASTTVGATDIARVELAVDAPILWDIHGGQLHTLVTEVEVGGEVVDAVETTFGLRSIEFRGREGLFVNGRHVRLRGANIHQDFAGLGIALPDRVIEHKLRLLAEMGCNAVRTAHHPPAPALLDAADRLGMLVIAENRLLSNAPPYIEDLEWLVVRGRNHPSVFLWSLENEEYLQGTERGARILRSLVRRVRELDPTRPTVVGVPKGFDSAYLDEVDVVGAHYQSLNQLIGPVQALRPETPLIATEEGLFPTVRGQYEDDPVRGLASSFGTSMGLFGAFPRIVAHLTGDDPITYDLGATWSWFADHPETYGGFVWAGIDYLGEPTPMQWPVGVSNYGAMDLCGFPKDYYWLLRAAFRPEPLVHVLPHWTWPGSEGKPLRLWIYSNCDEVELLLNDVSLGRRPVVDLVARWEDGVIYDPGSLVARGFRCGEPAAEQLAVTAGPPQRLHCAVSSPVAHADGEDVVLVAIDVVDADGLLCPWAEDDIAFEVAGPGELIGVGNGDPTSLEGHKASHRRAFRGRALAIVRAHAGEGGTVTLHATAEHLQDGSASFEAMSS